MLGVRSVIVAFIADRATKTTYTPLSRIFQLHYKLQPLLRQFLPVQTVVMLLTPWTPLSPPSLTSVLNFHIHYRILSENVFIGHSLMLFIPLLFSSPLLPHFENHIMSPLLSSLKPSSIHHSSFILIHATEHLSCMFVYKSYNGTITIGNMRHKEPDEKNQIYKKSQLLCDLCFSSI